MNKSNYRRKTEAFHLPTKWLFFYLFIRFPLALLASFIVIVRDYLPLAPYLSTGRVPGLIIIAGILEIGNLALATVTFIKLLKLSPASFKWNQAYLWYSAGCQLFSCFLIYGFSAYFMGSLAGAFGWTISNLVYFNNRSELFEMEVPAVASSYAPDYSYTQQPYAPTESAPFAPAGTPYAASGGAHASMPYTANSETHTGRSYVAGDEAPAARPANAAPPPISEAPAPSAKFCSKCGSPILPGAKFCNRCGNLLTIDPLGEKHEL